MSNNPFIIKQGDTSPSFMYQLSLPDGVTLEGATVRFHMAQLDGTVVIDASGSIESVTEEQIKYDWAPGNTATVDTYNAEFEVTFANGMIETFPNGGYEKVRVMEGLA